MTDCKPKVGEVWGIKQHRKYERHVIEVVGWAGVSYVVYGELWEKKARPQLQVCTLKRWGTWERNEGVQRGTRRKV